MGLAVLMIGSLAATAFPALASSATVKLSPSVGPPTTKTKVSGTGFAGSETIQLYFESAAVGTATAGATGAFKKTVSIPASAPSGMHAIRAVGLSSGLQAAAAFTVRVDWPQFGANAAHTGFNPFENTLNSFNSGSLAARCSAKTSGAIDGPLAVAGGLIYAGSGDGTLYALDEAACAQAWSFATGGPIGAGTAVDAGMVFAASSDGTLYGLNSTTGKLIWSQALGSALHETPVVANGTVYELSGIIGCNEIAAFAESTGTPLWTDTFTGEDLTPPAVEPSGQLVLGSSSGTLRALDAKSGQTVWSVQASGAIVGSPSVGGTPTEPVVYVGTDQGSTGSLAAYGATGTLQWSAPLLAPDHSTAALASGDAYTGDTGGNVYAAGPAGKLLWQGSVMGSPIESSLAVANGVVYGTSGESGIIGCNGFAFDAATGAMLWDHDGPASTSSPAVVNGRLITADSSGAITSYQVGQ